MSKNKSSKPSRTERVASEIKIAEAAAAGRTERLGRHVGGGVYLRPIATGGFGLFDGTAREPVATIATDDAATVSAALDALVTASEQAVQAMRERDRAARAAMKM
jgi:hypothetical protein